MPWNYFFWGIGSTQVRSPSVLWPTLILLDNDHSLESRPNWFNCFAILSMGMWILVWMAWQNARATCPFRNAFLSEYKTIYCVIQVDVAIVSWRIPHKFSYVFVLDARDLSRSTYVYVLRVLHLRVIKVSWILYFKGILLKRNRA